MNRRRLDHRAARRNEPPETLNGWKQTDSTGLRTTNTYLTSDVQMRKNGLCFEARVENSQAGGIQVYAGIKKAMLLAVQNDPGVDELAALDSRNHAQKRVFEGTVLGFSHGPLPPTLLANGPKLVAPSIACLDSSGRHFGLRRRYRNQARR